MSRILTIVTVLLIALNNVFCYNILAIISVPLGSHYMAFGNLFKELANRGHFVTVMNNFPEAEPVPNLEFINLKAGGSVFGTPPLVVFEKTHSSYLHLYNFFKHFSTTERIKSDCEMILTNKDIKEHLLKGVKYDVIFVEQFTSDCALAYAGVFFDAPIIGITSHVLMPWSYPKLGLPFDIASDAFYFSNAGSNPSIYHKLETILCNFYIHTLGRWFAHKTIYNEFHRHHPNVSFDLDEIGKERMKMIFSNQHYSITGGRVLAPQLLEIGGIHIDKPKTLPKDLEKFLTQAENGVIYVSLGSNLKANTMSQHKLNCFLTAFKNIPQKVLWKYENKTLPPGNDNIYVSKWVPQLEVLCHPKVLGFVSHGGMLSMAEAAYCGKPVLAMPFFGDQFANVASLKSSGLGIGMFFYDLNAENFLQGLKTILSLEMQQNAKRISKLFHDRPMSVMDSAIYWTEYVARHRTMPPSLPSKHNAWFESSLLDVYVLLFVILLSIYYVLKSLLKIVVKLLCKVICKKKYKSD